MKLHKKLLACSALLLATAGVSANNGLYEVEVTGLQGLNILEGTTVWQPHPLYPKLALRRGVEGKVLVQYTINAEGKAQNINILQSSPRGFFNNATIRALENATFGVAYQEGNAVAIEGVQKRFVYKIEEARDGSSQALVTVN